jgi:site-specific DNA recombinase
MALKKLRCAIYTRKSTDHGLELEFNSLDAQREACEAYIKSQLAEGWQLVPTQYDDGAYSGGDLDRPALQKLLNDIDAGLVDVIVVYKIDRLTRSLADFAKLVEIFDAKKISFVAITQQFNTTTSMGRLTLNILLSFAQFERELSSERVRDKIAASRKKGKWTGGSVPLGYDTRDKKLVINQKEAGIVRMIFNRYLVLKSVQKVIDELNEKGIVSKVREAKGRTLGGVPFTYGPVAYLLKSRTYLAEMGHKGVWFPGEHKAIIDQRTFDQVQDLLKTNSDGRTGKRHQNGALLTGLLFDDNGNRMSPSFTVKRGVRYCFYVSSAVLKGRKSQAGSRTRVSSDVVEGAVARILREYLPELASQSPQDIQVAVSQRVSRVVLSNEDIRITLRSEAGEMLPEIRVPRPASPSRQPQVNEPACAERQPNQQFLQALVRAHSWVKLLADGHHESVESLGNSVGLHPKVIRNGIRLAFLDPTVTKTLLQGQQASTLCLKVFAGAIPLSWLEQRAWVAGSQTD